MGRSAQLDVGSVEGGATSCTVSVHTEKVTLQSLHYFKNRYNFYLFFRPLCYIYLTAVSVIGFGGLQSP